MRHRFWLFQRGRTYYVEDTLTRRQESLDTQNRTEAERLRSAKETAAGQPHASLAIGKAYLAAHDPQLVRRTWRSVMDDFVQRGQEQTRERKRRAMRSAPFRLVADKKLVDTTADDFRHVLVAGGSTTNLILRRVQNFALGMGRLTGPIIPPKLWPIANPRLKRGITQQEHQKIIAADINVERRHYYELLWEIGAAQTDTALLTAEYIDWERRVLQYQRRKTGEWACIQIGPRLELLLRKLPHTGPLFPQIAQSTDRARAAEFCRHSRTVDVKGVSLHSYRYAWAERARAAGYPERHAQNTLGHTQFTRSPRGVRQRCHCDLPVSGNLRDEIWYVAALGEHSTSMTTWSRVRHLRHHKSPSLVLSRFRWAARIRSVSPHVLVR